VGHGGGRITFEGVEWHLDNTLLIRLMQAGRIGSNVSGPDLLSRLIKAAWEGDLLLPAVPL
jgi:hypothetical protein